MSSLRDTIVGWIDERLRQMLAQPRAWGSDESIEMQTLLLLELRALTIQPAQELANPRHVIDSYIEYLRRAHPTKPNLPLCEIVEHDQLGQNLAGELRKVLDAFMPSMLEENPFQHSELTLRLVFEAGTTPTTSAFTRYYEEFRRAARAVARPGDRNIGRAPKNIENATDFTLSDVRVTPSNGMPAEALLLLGPARGPAFAQRDYLAETQVRDAIANLVAMGEWAGSATSTAHLPVDTVDQRNRIAVQALRVVPRHGIARAEIGGSLIGRAKPVEFLPAYERRFVEVIGASAPSEPFNEVMEIRGLDLDRGLVVLDRTRRLPCYVLPELLGVVAMVGIQARVRGMLYHPPTGRPFVLAEAVDAVGADRDDFLAS